MKYDNDSLYYIKDLQMEKAINFNTFSKLKWLFSILNQINSINIPFTIVHYVLKLITLMLLIANANDIAWLKQGRLKLNYQPQLCIVKKRLLLSYIVVFKMVGGRVREERYCLRYKL